MELLKILRFPYNISATAGSSDFFGAQLGFAKTHHKITRRRKDGRGPGLGELLKIWGFPFNVYTMAEASDFKFGAWLGFAKAHHKIKRREKDLRGPGLGELPKIWQYSSIFTRWLKLATSNLAHSLGLPRFIIKSHTEEKVVLYYISSPKFCRSPLIFV